MKSVSTQQFKEQQEMNSLFKEHGTVNTKPETETGSAYFYGFRVMSHDKKNETLDLRLYFLAEDDVLVSKITYCKDNPHTLIKHLRSDNLGTLELSEMLGTEIEYKNKNEQWLVNGLDIEIEKFNTYIDDWEPMNSLSEEQQFIDFHHVDESEEHPKKGHGMITDYYVRNSASNIEQDLEIGITVKLPDDTEEEFECIHDSEIPDGCLVKLLDYSRDYDSISGLKGEKVPVIYEDSEEQWHFHFKRNIIDVRYYYERLFSTFDPHKVSSRRNPINKVYKSMNGT